MTNFRGFGPELVSYGKIGHLEKVSTHWTLCIWVMHFENPRARRDLSHGSDRSSLLWISLCRLTGPPMGFG